MNTYSTQFFLGTLAFGLGWCLRPMVSRNTAVPVLAQPPVVVQKSAPTTPMVVQPVAMKMDPRKPVVTLTQLKAQRLPGSGGTPLEKLQQLADFAATDPASALSFAQTLPVDEQQAAVLTVFSTWAATAPSAAAAELEMGLDSPLGLTPDLAAAAGETLVKHWAAKDAESAVAWAQNLPEDLQTAALRGIGSLAAEDSSKALTIFSSLATNTAKTAAAEPLAAQWAARDATASARWAMSLADADQRAAALSGVTSTWMNQDPTAASQWVNALPAGQGKDAAVTALVTSQAIRNDIPSAVHWAQSISDPAVRQELMTELADRYSIFLKLP